MPRAIAASIIRRQNYDRNFSISTLGGFILTTRVGIAGAFVATFIGQTIGWFRLDQGAGLIGASIGSLLVLFVWNRLVAYRAVPDPGNPLAPTRRRAASSRDLVARS